MDFNNDTQILENEYVHLELNNGIIIGTYKSNIITLNAAIEVVALRKKMSGNKSFPTLIKDYSVIRIEKKAREYFASDVGSQGIESVAVLTDSIYKSALMNFFIKVLPPKMPVKLFNNEKEALLWLNQLKKTSNE